MPDPESMRIGGSQSDLKKNLSLYLASSIISAFKTKRKKGKKDCRMVINCKLAIPASPSEGYASRIC